MNKTKKKTYAQWLAAAKRNTRVVETETVLILKLKRRVMGWSIKDIGVAVLSTLSHDASGHLWLRRQGTDAPSFIAPSEIIGICTVTGKTKEMLSIKTDAPEEIHAAVLTKVKSGDVTDDFFTMLK